MGLKIRSELMELYGEFYIFALGKLTDGLILDSITDDSAAALTLEQKSSRIVCVKNSPQLSSLSFLESFESAELIGVFGCKQVHKVWDISQNKKLCGIALCQNKMLIDLSALSYASGLNHVFIDSGKFNRVCLDSLLPLKSHKNMLTLDLAFSKLSHDEKIDFNATWPNLKSLSITPALRKYFKTSGEI